MLISQSSTRFLLINVLKYVYNMFDEHPNFIFHTLVHGWVCGRGCDFGCDCCFGCFRNVPCYRTGYKFLPFTYPRSEIFRDYTMAKVVSSHISARHSCILQREVLYRLKTAGLGRYKTHDPRENKTREGWCAGQYNFSHGIVFLSHTNIFSQSRPRLENCSLEGNLP